MLISPVHIVNRALFKVGAARITSLDDETKFAIIAKENYAAWRDEVLESHPWNFALQWRSLGQQGDFSHPIFSNGFVIPEDCLRPHATDLGHGQTWKVESGLIVCNSDSLNAQMITRVTDESKFSPTFVEAFANRMAFDFAYSVANSASLQKNMLDAWSVSTGIARSNDAQGGGTPSRVTAIGWLARRGSRLR